MKKLIATLIAFSFLMCQDTKGSNRRTICFPTVEATCLVFTVQDSKAEPLIKRIGLYNASELNE